MKHNFVYLLTIGILILTLFACSDSDNDSDENSVVSSSSSIGVALPSLGEYWNPDIDYGSFTDIRDGKDYRTVEINAQTWLAENLNYAASGSWCYNNNAANCEIYGRLYDWATAIVACPTGWHLPSIEEWENLQKYIDIDNYTDIPHNNHNVGTKLKSANGWNEYEEVPFGTDNYGFSGLPGGSHRVSSLGDHFEYIGDKGLWWSSSEDSELYDDNACIKGMRYDIEDFAFGSYTYERGLSVRCVKD